MCIGGEGRVERAYKYNISKSGRTNKFDFGHSLLDGLDDAEIWLNLCILFRL